MQIPTLKEDEIFLKNIRNRKTYFPMKTDFLQKAQNTAH